MTRSPPDCNKLLLQLPQSYHSSQYVVMGSSQKLISTPCHMTSRLVVNDACTISEPGASVMALCVNRYKVVSVSTPPVSKCTPDPETGCAPVS